jgi:phage replication-related protein YjqB (UPF0714/DUF867 family)
VASICMLGSWFDTTLFTERFQLYSRDGMLQRKSVEMHLRTTRFRETGSSKLEHSGTMVAMSGYKGGKILGRAIAASAESKLHKKARAVAP